MVASLVLGAKLVQQRRSQTRRLFTSVAASSKGPCKTRREKVSLDVMIAAVLGTPLPATAKGGNPYLLLQDGMEAFKKNRVEDSINLFDKAAESGYPKACICHEVV